MCAVIPVDHSPCCGFSGIDRHGERIGSQVCSDYLTRERVQHDPTEQFPFARGMFGDVCHPKLIRPGAGEVPLDQVSDGDPWWGSLAVTPRNRQAGQARSTYQRSHGVLSDPQPMSVDQLRVHALPAVRSSGFRVDRGDHVGQPRVTY